MTLTGQKFQPAILGETVAKWRRRAVTTAVRSAVATVVRSAVTTVATVVGALAVPAESTPESSSAGLGSVVQPAMAAAENPPNEAATITKEVHERMNTSTQGRIWKP